MVAGMPSIDPKDLWSSVERVDTEPMTLPRFDHDEALAAGTPFTPLIQVWMARRVQNPVPEWDDFDFADFRGWHSELIVSIFPDDEADPEFRIIGEGWRILQQHNGVGLRFSQVLPRLYGFQFREHFREIRDLGKVGWAAGRSPHIGRGQIPFQAIELPFRRDGNRVAGLLHGVVLDD